MKSYETPIDSAEVHFSGWYQLSDTIEITAAPLVDSSQLVTTFARLTYRSALLVCARLHARLLTVEEHDRVAKIGKLLLPVLKRPGLLMASLRYAQEHDAALLSQLDDWDYRVPLSNAGKQWIHGAKPGRALNYGWYDRRAPNGRIWQTLGTRHNDLHTDYSQLTMVARPICFY